MEGVLSTMYNILNTCFLPGVTRFGRFMCHEDANVGGVKISFVTTSSHTSMNRKHWFGDNFALQSTFSYLYMTNGNLQFNDFL